MRAYRASFDRRTIQRFSTANHSSLCCSKFATGFPVGSRPLFLGAIAVVFIFWGIQFESTATTASPRRSTARASRRTRAQGAGRIARAELQRTLRDELPPELVEAEQKKLVDEFIAASCWCSVRTTRLSRERR